MGNSININCYELYKNGIYLNTQVSRLKEIVEEMRIINNDMKDSWNGIEYDKFYQSFANFLDRYDEIENNIMDNAAVMKEVAKKHGTIETDLKETVREWEVNHNEN